MDNELSNAITNDFMNINRHSNVHSVENVLLIWLDININKNNNEIYQNTIIQLHRIVNRVNMFTDVDQCIDFLTDNDNVKVLMIISGEFNQYIVSLIHDIIQLNSIFIFCKNKIVYENWINEWSKIKGIFTEILPIYKALKQTIQQCEHNAISISFISTNEIELNNNFDQLDPSFMYTQILKEIIFTIKFQEKHLKEFINYCREIMTNNEYQLNNIDEFEQKYHEKTPIHWYTCESFLYPMLNQALRTMNVDIILKMGFFIQNLHNHIKQLHIEQYHSMKPFTVYRGQGLSKNDFNQMMKIKNGLISFNSFLSTSKDREVSFAFAESNGTSSDLIGILFEINVNPSITSTPFASINNISYFEIEDEVLFSMHTIFRICDIKSIDENNLLWQVNLTLTDDNDQELRALTEHIREETFPNSNGWVRLAELLIKMEQFSKAQEIYEILLNQITNEAEKGFIYEKLGTAKLYQEKHEEALSFYQKSLEKFQKTVPQKHLFFSACYNNIGAVYYNCRAYPKALSFFEKALEISQDIRSPNHPDLANFYNNIASVYGEMGDNLKAISFCKKSLEILEKILPSNHPSLANSYQNIGIRYVKMNEHLKGMPFLEKALEIKKKVLPPDHSDLANAYNDLGIISKKLGDYSKAFSLYEKAIEIWQKTRSLNHPRVAITYSNIALIYYEMGEYLKSHTFYEKALEIDEKILPLNHPHLAVSYECVGSVYATIGHYSKALPYYEQTLKIRQNTLPLNHPDLVSSFRKIGHVHVAMGNYVKALSFYEESLQIQQEILSSNDPELARSYNDIASVYNRMNKYSEALTYYEKSLEIYEKIRSPDHSDFVFAYMRHGTVYYSMGEDLKALTYYKRVLEIEKKVPVLGNFDLAALYNLICVVYTQMGEYTKAIEFCECAIDIAQTVLSSDDFVLQGYIGNLHTLRNKLKD